MQPMTTACTWRADKVGCSITHQASSMCNIIFSILKARPLFRQFSCFDKSASMLAAVFEALLLPLFKFGRLPHEGL